MPVALSYPGVYIEEVPSGVRALAGVATSICAFIGNALRGPVDMPVRLSSLADAQRRFGGLSRFSPLSYALVHFFQNGGRDAIVIRVDNGGATATASAGTGTALPLAAASPGLWGNGLFARLDHNVRPMVGDERLFNLILVDTATGTSERHINVSSLIAHPRYVRTVLDQSSGLARLDMGGGPSEDRPGPDAGGELATPADPEYSPFAGGTDGNPITDAEVAAALPLLENVDLFNLLVLPRLPSPVPGEWDDLDDATRTAAIDLCERERALFVADPLLAWTTVTAAESADLGAAGLTRSANAALYFPDMLASDPLEDGRSRAFGPSAAVAGLMARTDGARGIWKAPAGIEAALAGAVGLSVVMNDAENGRLNPLGINCLRAFPNIGRVVWGARTLRGSDILASEWKYVPVRRTALFLEESLYRGSQWMVFEPNDEPLWAEARMAIGGFLQGLFRQGAFAGRSPREAYFVKCDRETTTQADILNGVVNIHVGFAPLRPAEFVVIRIQQMAGQTEA
jgi:hypothetical protein